MELSCGQIATSNHGDEIFAVVTGGGDEPRVLGYHVIAVNEVEMRTGSNILQDRMVRLSQCQRVPAHVRDLEVRLGLEPDDLARDDTQPLVFAVFIADIEQELQSQANSQEGLATVDGIVNRWHEIEPFEFGDRVAKCAHTRQHHAVGICQIARVVRNYGLKAQLLERLLDAPQIAHSVVDDVQHGWRVFRRQLSVNSSNPRGPALVNDN